MRRLIVLASAFILIACVNKPISMEEATDIPLERIISQKYAENNENNGTIILVREGKLFEALCTTKIFVNSQPVADMAIGEKMILHLPEGRYRLSAWPNGFCGGGFSNKVLNVSKEKNRIYRISFGSNGVYKLVQTDY